MKNQKRFLTGITPSGTPHLGNYIGCILPALARQMQDTETLYFIADYHSLVKLQDRALRAQYILEVAATWLSLGLNPERTILYRQSDIPEVMELNWILSTVAAKGLLNRAHAYKAQVAINLEDSSKDEDAGISMGLFCYPILMAADILMFNPHYVPVGKDQVQHIEIARDIAQRFNHIYGETFVLPEAVIEEAGQVIPGLDGRKMSKSYGNTIPVFLPESQLRKHIMRIVTNSQLPGEPKATEGCTLFALYSAVASSSEIAAVKQRYAEGVAWGEMKQILFEKLNAILIEPRARYQDYLAEPHKLCNILKEGAEKARSYSMPLLKEIRQQIGI